MHEEGQAYMKLNYWLIPAQILHMHRIFRHIKFNNLIAITCLFHSQLRLSVYHLQPCH